MIEIAGDGCVLGLKFPQPLFHPMVGGGLPHKLHFVWIVSLRWGRAGEQLKTYFLVACNFDHNSLGTPLALVADLELIAREQAGVVIFPTSEHEVRISLLTLWANIESYFHIVLGLAFLNFAVRLRLF